MSLSEVPSSLPSILSTVLIITLIKSIFFHSLNPENGKIAVCLVDGEFTVKRIKKEKNKLYLIPENKKYKPIELKEENELIIWGVVEYVIKKV